MLASIKIALSGLISSKKFWSACIGSAIVTGMTLAHLPLEATITVGGLFGLHISAQGYADGNK